MSDDRLDPTPWHELRQHLTDAARLLRDLRKTHGDQLDFKHYSKLQFAETTLDKFAQDVDAVSGSLGIDPPSGPAASES